MGIKEIYEFEKQIAMLPLKMIPDSGLKDALEKGTEKILDGLIAMTEPKISVQGKSEKKASENKNQEAGKDTEFSTNQSSQNIFWNFFKILSAKKIGSVIALGPQNSGKTTLWQSADQIYNLHKSNYSCKINYSGNYRSGETDLRVPQKRFTTGRFILPTNDGNITFYTPADACGSRDGQNRILKKDLDKSTIIIFCFNLEWLYNNKQIPLTEKIQISISEYLRVWTKYVLATLKSKDKKTQKRRRFFIYLATHTDADACKKSNDADSIIMDKMNFHLIDEYIQAYNQDISGDSIQNNFVKGSFDTRENAEQVWEKLTKAMNQF